MSKVKIELNHDAIRDLLRSSEVQTVCVEEAQKISSRAGDGYSVNARVNEGRAYATVKTDTKETYIDCLRNNTLLKAVL